jgi:hypothetical protein
LTDNPISGNRIKSSHFTLQLSSTKCIPYHYSELDTLFCYDRHQNYSMASVPQIGTIVEV